ncbi:hypothetical protein ASF91_23005 [Rhizobium sp. Leaf155]|nr:hypothetical protein ASF91_23005 [Rhizobium sp. Leaf155]
MLKRWNVFTSFLDDGRTCLTNKAAEGALTSFALAGTSRLFALADLGADRTTFMATDHDRQVQ